MPSDSLLTVFPNAGIEIKKPFVDVTDDEWNLVMNVNLFGSFLVHQAAAKQMILQGGGGKLINVSSVHEDIPFPQFTAYCASKGGMRMMMRNVAMEQRKADNEITKEFIKSIA